MPARNRLTLSEEEQHLERTAQAFFADKMPVAHLRGLRDGGDQLGYAPQMWREMAGLGMAGPLVPEQAGGLDFGLGGLGVLAREAGRHLSPSPLLSTATLGASLLGAAGQGQLERLRLLAEGGLVTALALEEKSRHDPEGGAASAQRQGGGWVLSGSKTFVADGAGCDLLLVVAQLGGEGGIGVFAVPPDAQGVAVTRLHSADSRNFAGVELDGVALDEGALLCAGSEARAALDTALDRGRVVLAAEMLGMADECFARTVEYLKERKQFGARIGSFQALQHRAATMYSELEVARSAVLAAQNEADPQALPVAASLAKGSMGPALLLVTNEAIQMHGGMGVTDELDLGLFLKRARVCEQLLGDTDFHNDRYARLSGF